MLPPEIGDGVVDKTLALKDTISSFSLTVSSPSSPGASDRTHYTEVCEATRVVSEEVHTLTQTVGAYVYLLQLDDDETAIKAVRAVSMHHPSVSSRCDILLAQVL